ncbi:MAG: branched-chain amino acid transport system substrate-binding protein [Desulfovibrionales bacterium]|jgi:branched-chain amino acid transport system substrate-binding protein|nr:branched-chain amino acid transport system substrate-binding protein [Desulfovibrionales bacterium]
MKKLALAVTVLGLAVAFLALTACQKGNEVEKSKSIKIGFNLPLTGDIPKVGESSKFAAEMLKDEINAQGGLMVGGERYPLEFVYEDNESKAESAVNAALKLIEQDKVVAIIGPNSSKQAVPAGGTCNDNACPMISPWSTNPAATKDRPWVFRAAFLDPFQGPVAANFATKKFNAAKAAVLFDISNDYSKGLAEIFREVWEKKHGEGSVSAFESHGTKDQDFSAQLTKIINADPKPDFIFVPDNYNQVALIVKQAHDLGWEGPFMGADAWGSAELMELCGKDCIGQYFSTHYAAAGATGKTKEFIDKYNAKYGYVPDDVAALTWDAINLVLQAISSAPTYSSDVAKEREIIRNSLANIADFDGITGAMSFDEQGDPIKCAVIVRIDDDGQFVFTESVCPDK